MIKKNLFYNSLLSMSQVLFPLVSFPYASRILGPSGLGSVSFVDSFTSYFILFSALGIPIYGVREIAKVKDNPTKLNEVFNELFKINLSATTLFAVIYIVLIFTLPQLQSYTQFGLIGIGILFLNVLSLEWLFQGLEKFEYISKRTIIIRFLSLILLFVFLKPNSSPIIYYLIIASTFLFGGLSNLLYGLKFIRFNAVVNAKKLVRHVRPLVVILGSTLAVSIYILMDNLLLGLIKGDEAVGIYSTAIRIIKVPFAFITAIASIIIPQMSRAYSENNVLEMQSLINKSFTFICVVSIPISVGLVTSSSFIVNIFAGNKFQDAIPVLKILAPLNIIVGIGSIFGVQILTTIGKERYLLRAVVIGMLFSISCNLVLINFFSEIGAAVTSLLTEIGVTILTIFFARQHIKIKIKHAVFFQCLIGSIPFLFIRYASSFLSIGYNLREVLIIISCGIFYLTYLWFFVKNEYIINLKMSVISKLHFQREP